MQLPLQSQYSFYTLESLTQEVGCVVIHNNVGIDARGDVAGGLVQVLVLDPVAVLVGLVKTFLVEFVGEALGIPAGSRKTSITGFRASNTFHEGFGSGPGC